MSTDVQALAASSSDLDRSLLELKLSIPESRLGTVSRRALIEKGRSSARPVVAVTAPAGYGKSTFLAEWARAEDRRVAWVTLERFDDDPGALLRVLAYAYGRIDTGRPGLVAEVEGIGASLLGRAAPRLAMAYRATPTPFVLFLDDLHELQSEDCHDILGFVIEAVPPGSQLVTASRSEHPHLPRLRVSGCSVEFAAADLALDAAGVDQVFASERVVLSKEEASELLRRTEGWPAGLRMAAMIAKEGQGPAGVIAGDDRYVVDYLQREFWNRLPADLQQFLLSTAILDQLCAPLCDAVLGSSSSAEQLRRLEASSSFVIALDRRRDWYRYHSLFREFLLDKLRLNQVKDIEALHSRAADWYELHGTRAMAIEHLLETAEHDRTVQLMLQVAQSTYQNGHYSTWIKWLSTVGDDVIQSYPPLAIQACWAGILTGDATGTERWWRSVRDASFASDPGDGTASFDSARAMLRMAMCESGPDVMMKDALFAVEQEPLAGAWRDTAIWGLAEAQLLMGRANEARSNFVEAARIGADLGYSDTIIICASELALLALDAGDWKEARDQVDVALFKIAEKQVADYVNSVLAYPAAARLAVHDGQGDEARMRLVEGMRSRTRVTYVYPFIAVRLRLELAKAYCATNDQNAARQLLREIDEILSRRPKLGSLVDQTKELRVALGNATVIGSTPLTPAELRVLPYLQTHLTIAAIGQRLFVSRATVSSQITSIYRKLGVSSREEAVERANSIGFLGG